MTLKLSNKYNKNLLLIANAGSKKQAKTQGIAQQPSHSQTGRSSWASHQKHPEKIEPQLLRSGHHPQKQTDHLLKLRTLWRAALNHRTSNPKKRQATKRKSPIAQSFQVEIEENFTKIEDRQLFPGWKIRWVWYCHHQRESTRQEGQGASRTDKQILATQQR